MELLSISCIVILQGSIPEDHKFRQLAHKYEMSDIREEVTDLEIQNHEQRCFVPYDALKDLLSESRVAALIIRALSEKGEIRGLAAA